MSVWTIHFILKDSFPMNKSLSIREKNEVIIWDNEIKEQTTQQDVVVVTVIHR